jgi:hypothetical protein
LPETFSGEGDLAEWIDHFESVAAVNESDDTGKLQWLRVRLTGRALTAFKRFPEGAKTSFGAATTALKERLDPESHRELHIVEFQTRKKSRTESWADFGEDLRILADRAYPDLQEEARERLSLNRYLDQLTDPQIAFVVRQTLPKSVDWATLRLESYQIRPAKPVGLVQETRELSPQLLVETVVGAVGGRPKENSTAALIQSLVERIEHLETDKRHSTEEQRLQDRRTEGEQRKNIEEDWVRRDKNEGQVTKDAPLSSAIVVVKKDTMPGGVQREEPLARETYNPPRYGPSGGG